MLVVSTDRHGGLGVSPYQSLNLSYGVGDNPALVTANRERLKDKHSIPVLLSAYQVHGDAIFVLDEPLHADLEVDNYDALITDQSNTGLLIQQADCQAICLYDPDRPAIAAIHSGWQGSVRNIAAKTVERLCKKYDSSPDKIQAFISPSLGPCCAEFVNHALEFPSSFLSFEESRNHFNFWKISTMQLMEAGIPAENISVSGVCTSCSSDYFSYRRACRNGNGVTGRCATLITL